MKDWTCLEYSGGLVFIDLFLYLCMFLLFRPAFKYGTDLPRRRYVWGVVCIFAFCLLSFWGTDWFHYAGRYEGIRQGDTDVNQEMVYTWLMQISPSYIIWRAITWGVAIWCLIRTLKNLDIDINIALFFFCSIFIIWFSYARASLAMAMMFYGYSCLQVKEKRALNMVWGFLLIGLSFFMHKSAPFGIAIVLAAEFCKHYGKTAVILFLIGFPIIVMMAKMMFTDFFDAILMDESNALNEYASGGSGYLDEETGKRGWGGRIGSMLCTVTYYLIAIESALVLWKKQTDISEKGKAFLLLTVFLVLSSSVFRFDLGANTLTLYGRFLRFTQIPATIALTYIYSTKQYPRLTRVTYQIAILSAVYSLAYSLYISIL